MNRIINNIGSDKILHFAVSFVVATTLFIVNVLAGITGSLLLGLLKEYSDSKENNNRWCWDDILFNISGIIFATVVYYFQIR